MKREKCPKCKQPTFFANDSDGECRNCGYKIQASSSGGACKGKNKGFLFYAIGSIATLGVSCFLTPMILKKCTNNLYKSMVKKENQKDDDDWGPEIIKKIK